MKFLITILVCCFVASQIIAQTADTINWRANYKLKWSDFKGTTDSNSVFTAISSITLDYYIIGTDDEIEEVGIKCVFDRNNSRLNSKKVKTMLNDSNLLKHEQTHFDISELYARKFMKRIKDALVKKVSITDNEIQSMYQHIIIEFDKINHRYDLETNFSKNGVIQKKWTNKINNEIKKLIQYSNYSTIKIK